MTFAITTIDQMEYASDAAVQAAYASNSPADIQAYAETSIKKTGVSSLKGTASQTSSLNKTISRTIATTIDLTGKTDFIGYIRSSRTGSNIKIGVAEFVNSNVTSGGTASADSQYNSSYAPSYAADGSTTTMWSSTATALPHWWKYDFGSGNSKAISRILHAADLISGVRLLSRHPDYTELLDEESPERNVNVCRFENSSNTDCSGCVDAIDLAHIAERHFCQGVKIITGQYQ